MLCREVKGLPLSCIRKTSLNFATKTVESSEDARLLAEKSSAMPLVVEGKANLSTSDI